MPLLRTSCIAMAMAWATLNAAAADWPQWRGPGRAGHTDASEPPLTSIPSEPRVLWRQRMGPGWASPIVASGRVFQADAQGGREVLHALDAEDGHELWRADVDAALHDEQGPDGPRGAALVSGERVFYQSCLGELQCRRAASGDLVWRTNYRRDFGSPWLGEDSAIPGAAEHGYTGSPVLAGGSLVACVGSTNGAGIVAFAPETGEVRWKAHSELAAYAAPMYATIAGEPQVVCFLVSGLVSIDPRDGHALWRFPMSAPYGRHCLTPVISGNRVITGSYRAGLIGLVIPPAAIGGTPVATWTNTAATMNFSSPVAVNGFVYGVGPDKNLVCVEASTGRLAWSHPGPFSGSAGNSHAAWIVLRDRILVVTDGGEALLIEANPSGFHERGRAQVCGRTWSSPAYSNGRLYVCDGLSGPGTLRCVDLRSGR